MNEKLRSKLFDAMRSDDLKAVKKLLAANPGTPLIRSDGRTLLHDAAWYGHLDLVKFFLKKGCLINSAVMPEESTARWRKPSTLQENILTANLSLLLSIYCRKVPTRISAVRSSAPSTTRTARLPCNL